MFEVYSVNVTKQEILAWCEEHAGEQLALLRTLAAIPAPSHSEHKRVEFIREWLAREGAQNVRVDEALNVVVPLACEGRRDIRVYMAHTDVVFPDLEPLPVREEAGRLYAPGAGDDTANVAALMLCVKFFLSRKLVPREPLLIVFNSCEEGLGNLKGVRQIMQEYAGRVREVVSFDGQSSSIVSRAVGSERWNVCATTCGGHSFGAFGKPNAIHHMARLIGRLYQQPLPQRHESKTTYNVGTIQGGTSVNTIAQQVEMTYEYRSDNRDCLQQMRKQFLDMVDEANGSEVSVQTTLLGERPCGGTVEESAQRQLLERCTRAIADVTGQLPAYRSGSTDANIPLSLGIPAATFGLYRGGGAHTRQEYVEIDSLGAGLQIALRLLTASCLET